MKKRQLKCVITLSNQEINQLEEITRKGSHSARVIKRAQVLLSSEQGLTDEEIADQMEIAISTAERIRYRFTEGGIERALYDAPRSGQPGSWTAKSKLISWPSPAAIRLKAEAAGRWSCCERN